MILESFGASWRRWRRRVSEQVGDEPVGEELSKMIADVRGLCGGKDMAQLLMGQAPIANALLAKRPTEFPARTALSDMADSRLQSYLRAAGFDVTAAAEKIRTHIKWRESLETCCVSPAVDAVLRSRRFRYLGMNRSGALVVCIDSMWGQFLEVEGGLTTVMEAMAQFLWNDMVPMAVADYGREVLLAEPPLAILWVGGPQPLSFARACRKALSDHYPEGLTHSVIWGSNRFQGRIFELVRMFLPEPGRDMVHWTNDLDELHRILDIPSGFLPEDVLGQDLPLAGQLGSTAAVDRDWVMGVVKARQQRVDDILSVDNNMGIDLTTVKNTFVELWDANSEVMFLRRSRTHSDGSEVMMLSQSVAPELAPPTFSTSVSSPCDGATSPHSWDGITACPPRDGATPLEDPTFYPAKPLNSLKRRKCGYTRRREKEGWRKRLPE